MLRVTLRSFSFVHDVLGFFNHSSNGYILGQYPPSRVIPEHSPLVHQDPSKKLHLSSLPNGVRIVSESEGLPSTVHMGVTIAAGTRDESEKYSGVVNALAQTYLKTNIRTNEQINYAMVQMSGGEFKMTYNQDFMNYYGHCLAHDTYDILQMLSDCVLDEKTIMDEEAAQWRTDEYWKLKEFTMTNWKKLDDVWLSTAYGHKGYGMPLSGFQSNFQNLGHYYLNQWRKHFVTPDRIIVWGAGIKNHSEFVHAVTPYFTHLEPVKAKSREPSKYVGGDYRELTEGKNTCISVSFLGPSRNSPQLAAAFVLKYIIGKCGGSASARGNSHLKQRYAGIEGVEAQHEAFADSGNFRINLSVKNENVRDAFDGLVKEINDLVNVSAEEVNRAKNELINISIRRSLNASRRVMKSVHGLAVTGKLSGVEEFANQVAAVTKESVKEVVEAMRKSRPTVVAIGGNTHDVPTADNLHTKLR